MKKLLLTTLVLLPLTATASPEMAANLNALRVLAQECKLHVQFNTQDWRKYCNNALELAYRVEEDFKTIDRSQFTETMARNLERAHADILEASVLMEFRN